MKKHAISWTNETWNPVAGCTKISPGCKFCYALSMAARFSADDKHGRQMWGKGVAEMTPSGPRWTGRVALVESKLELPLRWKKPRMVFVNSTSDLWHDALSLADIGRVYDVMAQCPQHTFQILTKRPLNRLDGYRNWLAGFTDATTDGPLRNGILPNVWEGASVESRNYLGRIDDLRSTPAALTFISFEPLLEDLGDLDLTGIDWAIIGGESGPKARLMEIGWARRIVAQCEAQGVRVFFKQYGTVQAKALGLSGKGADPKAWPEPWPQQFPEVKP